MLESNTGKHSHSILSYNFKEPNIDHPVEYIMPFFGSLLLSSLDFYSGEQCFWISYN